MPVPFDPDHGQAAHGAAYWTFHELHEAEMDHQNLPLAWGLTRGMARTLGLNLIEAVTEGWYSRTDLARLVDRCAECGLSDHCSAWLAVTPRAETLPGYCQNKAEIEVLTF